MEMTVIHAYVMVHAAVNDGVIKERKERPLGLAYLHSIPWLQDSNTLKAMHT